MRNILIVEDEDVLRESYELIISTEPYNVDIAKNGQEALDLCQKKKYDLILLDLMMPTLDGVGFLEKFENPGSKVIILSNLSAGPELEQALKLGASMNVLKATLSPRELLAKVRYEMSTN
jgi:DNA-binding response OmpR family regulator